MHGIILLAPIVLGTVFHILGRVQHRRLRVTAQKHESDRQFKVLIEGVRDHAIYLLDPDGCVMNWNSGAEQTIGYAAEDVKGVHLSQFFIETERAQGLPHKLLETARVEDRYEIEGWVRRKDGEKFWGNSVIHAIKDEQNILVGFANVTRDKTAERESANVIAHLARHDALTDLPNRIKFIESFDQQLLSAKTSDAKVAIVNIDLDHFKDVNDTYGHAAGDRLLNILAERMTDILHDGEMVSRFGGDEFVAYKVFARNDALKSFLKRLQKALTQPVFLQNNEITPGASFGISQYPQDGAERDQLLNNADLAMYRAKGNLEDRVCFYNASMDEAARERRGLIADLWVALKEEQFFLHYQEQRSVVSGEITGYEVLVRWQHPEKGLISPALFIPVAEECGAIPAIGEWVLETACREAVERGLEQKIAVNVSAAQLSKTTFIDKVRNILVETGLPAKKLELEVTETALFSDKECALHILRQIKAMGVTIAIDDFGTGYSSLETLRSFPFDTIKVDRSFVQELGLCHQSTAVVRAILALGGSLETKVLAEGVETEDQLAILAAEGCDEVQGFLFSYPAELKTMDESVDARQERKKASL